MEFKEYFRKNLNSNFEQNEIDKIEALFEKTVSEVNQLNSRKADNPKTENKVFENFLTSLIENPETVKTWIAEHKKADLGRIGLKISIPLIVVVPITYLSLNGVLGTCETATLFGGIVGYLLGELN